MHTVIGAFDDRAQAQRAVDRLVQSGIDREDVHIEQQDGGGQSGTSNWDGQEREIAADKKGGIGGFFSSLFGMEDNANTGHAHTYDEAVRRGSSVVVVDADNDQQAEQAATLLQELGAVDVDERAQQWRAQGWTGGGQQPDTAQSRLDLQGRASGTGDNAPPVGQEGVLDVVQEELKIGKRSLNRGGVRVVQRVSQKPVREVLRLREERAVVDRRPVDRPATSGDLSNFKEGTLEVRETSEEAVVSKNARVVEEVRVGKEVKEREEVIEDTVRRKDVDVQQLEGSRERAVASDRMDETSATERDSDLGGTSVTGTRKPRGDKPTR